MASIRQIRANRENSGASTGPSEEGKAASRTNAWVHGLASEVVDFEDDSERIQQKVLEWLPELKPEGLFQLYHVQEMAAAAVRIERCREQETDLRYRQALRSEEGRQLDLSVEADRIAVGLPRQPTRVARRLQQTVQGTEWLLERLRSLKHAIGGLAGSGPIRPLAEAERCVAFDVLGMAPLFRTGQTVLDLPAGAETATEVDLAMHQARVIDQRIARLEQFKNVDLAEVDAIDRDANAMGRDTRVDPEIAKILRYQKDAERKLEKHQAELYRLQALAREDRAAAESARREAEAEAENLIHQSLRREGSAAVAPAEPASEQPAPTVAPETEPATVRAASPAADGGHESFEAALREAFPTTEPTWSRNRRSTDRTARAAHKGFPA